MHPRLTLALAALLVLGVSRPAAAEEGHYARFRWGMSAVGGPMVGDISGGVGGINARFGAQINEYLGVTAQPLVLFGAGFNPDIENASASGLALIGVGVIPDVTLGDRFYVGAGPEFLLGAVAEGSTDESSASGGAFFSLNGRLGVVLGSVKPNRRIGFQLGLDMHVIFAPTHTVVAPLLALGVEGY